MPARKLGWFLFAGGGLLLAVSLLADVIGLGAQPDVFGWKQFLGAAVGFVSCLAGLGLLSVRAGEE